MCYTGHECLTLALMGYTGNQWVNIDNCGLTWAFYTTRHAKKKTPRSKIIQWVNLGTSGLNVKILDTSFDFFKLDRVPPPPPHQK